jgi:hypothetical protein
MYSIRNGEKIISADHKPPMHSVSVGKLVK